MGLNDYRDEAGDFLAKIGAAGVGIENKLIMLEEELNNLKASVDEPDKLKHQIYDMLFLLFEIASDYCFDLDAEWNKGRNRKQKYYKNFHCN